jgi:PBSX family phage portal protein
MDENEYYVGASLNTQQEDLNKFKDADPFNKNWDDLKNYAGLEKNFKRRTERLIKTQYDYSVPTNVVPSSESYLTSASAYSQGVEGAGSKQINPGSVYRNGYGLFDVITPPYNLYELANYYDTSFANHAAIDAKVANIAGLGYAFHVTDKTNLALDSREDSTAVDKARKRIERMKIELRDWLETLNDDDSFTTIIKKMLIDYESTGNGFLEISRTALGQIGYIGHVPATTIRVRRLRDGYLQIIGNKVVYFRNFGAKNPNPVTGDPRPNELIHYKSYSPLNTFYGIPDILSAVSSLIGDSLAAQYNIDYFQNKAVPRYIITLKGAKLSADAEDKMFRFLQTGLKSQSHRTLYIPLPGDSDGNKVDFKMEPIENGIQDGSFKEYRKQNRDDILIAHQVPISKLGGTDSGLAAAMSQDRTFKEQVSRPSQKHLEKIVNKIIKEKTDILELKFNELTLTDEIAQSQILERYVRNKIMVPNEARDLLDLPQRKDGDMPMELNPRQAADATANTRQNRQRDAERTNNASDSPATISGRSPQGESNSSE